jgi:hypothetical protein
LPLWLSDEKINVKPEGWTQIHSQLKQPFLAKTMCNLKNIYLFQFEFNANEVPMLPTSELQDIDTEERQKSMEFYLEQCRLESILYNSFLAKKFLDKFLSWDGQNIWLKLL